LIAIDTNIILRFLTRQPKTQFEAARSLFRKGGLFISTPVVMEAYFTLTGSVLAFSDDQALEALDAVLQLPGVTVQHADEVFTAIDKPFAKRAAKLKLKPLVQAP
jgi:predicted nucleic-acid-binding protein